MRSTKFGRPGSDWIITPPLRSLKTINVGVRRAAEATLRTPPELPPPPGVVLASPLLRRR